VATSLADARSETVNWMVQLMSASEEVEGRDDGEGWEA
jgi:hypothetical protein